jgi:DNA invertase Pin-like site-specific DNA recombinase
MDLRGIVSKTRHKLDFHILLPQSTISHQLNPDKIALREQIFALRLEGKSYREIAEIVNIHFTRVYQILNDQ